MGGKIRHAELSQGWRSNHRANDVRRSHRHGEPYDPDYQRGVDGGHEQAAPGKIDDDGRELPRPVSVTIPTMIPAAAQVVAALSTPIDPSAMAAVSFWDDGANCRPAAVRPRTARTAITSRINIG